MSSPASQEPAPADQSGTEFPLQPTSLIELDQKKRPQHTKLTSNIREENQATPLLPRTEEDVRAKKSRGRHKKRERTKTKTSKTQKCIIPRTSAHVKSGIWHLLASRSVFFAGSSASSQAAKTKKREREEERKKPAARKVPPRPRTADGQLAN